MFLINQFLIIVIIFTTYFNNIKAIVVIVTIMLTHKNKCICISCENSRFYAKKAEYRISLLSLTSNSKNKTVVSKLHCMSNL